MVPPVARKGGGERCAATPPDGLSVISYSLFGTNPRYLDGVLSNIRAAHKYYCGWQVWIYHDAQTPRAVIDKSQRLGPTVVWFNMSASTIPPTLWRARPLATVSSEPVSRFISRDIDARLGEREAAAVAEWISGGRRFHMMKDHPLHRSSMLMGTWGARAHAFDMDAIWRQMCSRPEHYARRHERTFDQEVFMRHYLYEIAQKSLLEHSSIQCPSRADEAHEGGHYVRPFPLPRDLNDDQHLWVGMPVGIDQSSLGKLRMSRFKNWLSSPQPRCLQPAARPQFLQHSLIPPGAIRRPLPALAPHNCQFELLRVPKAASTSLHNAIQSRPTLSKLVCSSIRHLALRDVPLSRRGVIVTLREPVERFASAYRYAWTDIGQPGLPDKRLNQRFPTIGSFVAALLARPALRAKELRAIIWHPITQILEVQSKAHQPALHYLCVSRQHPQILPLHVQLQALLNITIEPIEVENDTSNLTQHTIARQQLGGYDIPDDAAVKGIQELYARDVALFRRHCGAVPGSNAKLSRSVSELASHSRRQPVAKLETHALAASAELGTLPPAYYYPTKQVVDKVRDCVAVASSRWDSHHVNVVYSSRHRFVYIDNPKAASTTIRTRLWHALNVSWCDSTAKLDRPFKTCSWRNGDPNRNPQCQRLSSACLDGARLVREGYLIFTFLRSPVNKVLAGLVQAFTSGSNQESMRWPLTSAGIDKFIRTQERKWTQRMSLSGWHGAVHSLGRAGGRDSEDQYLNEHLQSNLWRLSGADSRGHPLPLSFVGSLNTLDRDWKVLVDLLRPRLSAAEHRKLDQPLPRDNPSTWDVKPLLTSANREAMCALSPPES